MTPDRQQRRAEHERFLDRPQSPFITVLTGLAETDPRRDLFTRLMGLRREQRLEDDERLGVVMVGTRQYERGDPLLVIGNKRADSMYVVQRVIGMNDTPVCESQDSISERNITVLPYRTS